ncbi:MAG: hypothetical protein Fur006_36250 [Coleofasciculaceae cyanobacterium]
MKHGDRVKRFNGTLVELAEDLGNLRYDALAQFLSTLSAKIEQDSNNDEQRGRRKLATALHDCAQHLTLSAKAIEQAWDICEPYMHK